MYNRSILVAIAGLVASMGYSNFSKWEYYCAPGKESIPKNKSQAKKRRAARRKGEVNKK